MPMAESVSSGHVTVVSLSGSLSDIHGDLKLDDFDTGFYENCLKTMNSAHSDCEPEMLLSLVLFLNQNSSIGT
jgi:hypothetical protein